MTRSYSYSFVSAPFPVTGYVATISVQDIADKAASLVTWSGSFSPVNVTDEEAVQLFRGIYEDGLTALKESILSGGK